ncbi:MAG: hypothetical protein JWN30_364 [Bacilli bacterium]|nr:hypothetical protein [Bacilli bacterium]
MAETIQYRTGEQVKTAGEYESEAGKRMQYRQGDLFEACPATGKTTNWKHCIIQ